MFFSYFMFLRGLFCSLGENDTDKKKIVTSNHDTSVLIVFISLLVPAILLLNRAGGCWHNGASYSLDPTTNSKFRFYKYQGNSVNHGLLNFLRPKSYSFKMYEKLSFLLKKSRTCGLKVLTKVPHNLISHSTQK